MQTPAPEAHDRESAQPPRILVFNVNDPSGAGGIAGDILAAASAGAHALPVMTGNLVRDTVEIHDQLALDEDMVAEQGRVILEDIRVNAIKVGFVGSPENLGVIAEIASDYPELPLIAYMPNLAWWNEVQIDLYQDAFRELVLPQATVLVGNHNALSRWLLPDWDGEKAPGPRDIARAAEEYGVPYTLVTGIPGPDQHIENALATPQTVLASQRVERFEVTFLGAGDTLSAALAALIAAGEELGEAFGEALDYLDHSLDHGFQLGMGHAIPDRLFWAHADTDDDSEDEDTDSHSSAMELPPHDTQH